MSYKIGDLVKLKPRFCPLDRVIMGKISSVSQDWGGGILYNIAYLDFRDKTQGNALWADEDLLPLNGTERIKVRHGL